ncbi:hypothetical protein EAN95_25360 [Klebsiella quasipneumoniae]|nr:hypothetical protein EAN95_25360 [Klebsiella quasipneumoniae]
MKPKIVPVVRYTRFRFGRVEHVRKHMRSPDALSERYPQVTALLVTPLFPAGLLIPPSWQDSDHRRLSE